MPVLTTSERLVKCPTGHCPGWITVDDERPQTVPCRYCRVTVNTLNYLLAQTPDASGDGDAPLPGLPAGVHEAFNSLLLTVAGQTGGNVYLRPIDRTLVNLVPSTRGVILEYNPALARRAGPAAVVALLLHPLLHIAIHAPAEKPLGLAMRAGARDREHLQNAANYLLRLIDHAWIAARIDAIDPTLQDAARAWGLSLTPMLTGNEAFFLPYMADRNRRWIVEQFADAAADAPALAAALLGRLAALSARFFSGQREDVRRALTTLQLADLALRDPDRVPAYQAALDDAGLPGVGAIAPAAARLAADVLAVQRDHPTLDSTAARQALEAGLKALGFHTAFEVHVLKTG